MRTAPATVGLALVSRVAAVLVADGSPCSTLCGNVLDSTTTDDVVCAEADYTEEDAGIVYQQCVTCEMTSDYHSSDNDTDVVALLYNLRYTVSYCLFGEPENDKIINTPCLTSEACGPFKESILHHNLSLHAEDFGYCNDWPVDDTEHVDQCADCLRAGDQNYLANFFSVLQAGCEQRPVPGVAVSTEGNVFSDDRVNATEPTPEATANPEWFDQGPLDLGAKAGIAAGGVVLILIIAGCCIVWRGKRRRRAFLSKYEAKPGMTRKTWPSPLHIQGMKEMNDTPLSQKPLRNWDDSPQSARSDQAFPRYFSPYSSHFSSPISATDAPLPQFPVMDQQQQMQMQQHIQMQMQHQQERAGQQNIGLAFGGDESSQDSKGKDKAESYEMHQYNGYYGGDGNPPQSPDQQSYFTHSHSRSYSGSYRNFSGKRDSTT